MTRTSLQLKVACWAWIGLCAAYFGWEYATYSGLYRWLAERQMEVFGKYATHLTAILPFFLVAGPALSLLGARHRQAQAARAAAGPSPTREDEFAKRRRSAHILVALAPICFVVAGVAYWIGQGEAVPPGEPVRVDLSTLGTQTPPGGRVSLLGTVLVDRGLTTTAEARWRTEERFYAPVVPRGQTAAPPGGFRFFVRRSSARSAGAPPLRQLFLGAETGILVPGGLPPEVRALYARAGLPVAEPHWLLTAPSAATDAYYTTAGVAGMVGLILLLGGGAALLGLRIRARRGVG